MRRLWLVMALLLASAGSALAWPNQRVLIVVPFPAGGTTDVLARIVGQRLAEIWGVPVIVENRGGAAGNLGTASFIRQTADGHSFLLHTSSLTVAPAVYRSPGFDVLRDLEPVTSVGSVPFLLVVNPAVPARNLPELVAHLRANPGRLSYASNGAGSIVHLAMELLLRDVGGLDVTHIPYRGSAPAVNDLLGGQTQMMVESVVTLLEHVRTQRLRAIATTGTTRIANLPDLPTVAEGGVAGYEAGSWYGLFAPKGASPATVAQLQADVARVIAMPDIRARLAALGAEGGGETSAAFGAAVAADLLRWNGVARAINLSLD